MQCQSATRVNLGVPAGCQPGARVSGGQGVPAQLQVRLPLPTDENGNRVCQLERYTLHRSAPSAAGPCTGLCVSTCVTDHRRPT